MGAFFLQLALGGFNLLKLFGKLVAGLAAKLNLQGWVGLGGICALAVLLVLQKGETRHWRKQSAGFETLYHRADQRFQREHIAFGRTVLNYRAAAEQARLADKANADRVKAEQRAINERTAHDYEARIADARARAERLRTGSAVADPGGGAGTAMPRLPAAAAGAAQTACDGLSAARPDADWRLCATEQAIQLDELISWVMQQAAIDVNGNAKPRL